MLFSQICPQVCNIVRQLQDGINRAINFFTHFVEVAFHISRTFSDIRVNISRIHSGSLVKSETICSDKSAHDVMSIASRLLVEKRIIGILIAPKLQEHQPMPYHDGDDNPKQKHEHFAGEIKHCSQGVPRH
jgi:hypothetical protein